MNKNAPALVSVIILSAAVAADLPLVAVRELEPVTVSATHREEAAGRVPLSLTAVPRARLEDSQALGLQDLTGLAPNLRFFSSGSRRTGLLFLRGLGSSGPNQPAVGVFVDDVFFGRTALADLDLFDAERVEVLRGPQGTLFGRNTQAGAIRLVSRPPPREGEGGLRQTFGEYGLERTVLRAGGPTGPSSALGLSALRYRRDGFTRNELLGRDADPVNRLAGRVQWQAVSESGTELRLTAYHDRDRDGGYAMTTLSGTERRPYRVAHNHQARHERDLASYGLRAVFPGPPFEVVSVSSFTRLRNQDVYDRDFSAMDLFLTDTRARMWAASQEVRLLSPDSGAPWRWSAGVYAYVGENEEEETAEYGSDAPLLGAPVGLREYSVLDRDERTGAVFGRLGWSFGSAWEITGGLRLEQSRVEAEGERGLRMGPRSLSRAPLERGLDTTEWLPELTLQYAPADWMLYSRAARGFRAGGFNTSPGSPETYDPEYTWNVEAGYKAVFRDRLTLALTVFQMDVEDQQLLTFHPAGAGFHLRNTGRSVSRGVELEVIARPFEGWRWEAGLGWNDARFRTHGSEPEDASYEGNRLPFAPRLTAHTAAQVRRPLHGGVALFGRTDVRMVGTTAWDEANRVKTDPYHLVHLRLGFETRRLDVYVFARNLFDERYQEAVYVFPGSEPMAFPGEPRLLGATMEMRF